MRKLGLCEMLRQRTHCKTVKRFAERVAPVAQTTHPTQAGLARVLNALVVPPFLRRGNLQCLQVVKLAPWGRGIYFAAKLPHKCVLFTLNR